MAEKPEVDEDACRAEIPPLMSPEQRAALAYAPRCRQRWGERPNDHAPPLLGPEDVQEFLTEFAWLKETELALQCLFDGDFDLPKAVQLLHAARRKRHKVQRDQDERLEPEDFRDAVEIHGKRFHLVQQALGQKVFTREVVSKYYLWKRTTEFRDWRLRQTAKKNKHKRKEAERLRQRGEEDADLETKAFLGYHTDRCELCATGGKLLCCDGCARAYHFCCVQPPITKVPGKDEDWFCPYCQEAFGGTKPKMAPSDENEYCQVCLPFPGVPRTLIEATTDVSSQEEDGELEENSDGEEGVEEADVGSESNDKHDDNISGFPSTEELSSNAGKRGSLTDNESDSTSNKIPSSSPGADSSRKHSKVEQKSGSAEASPAPKQQTRTEIQLGGASSQLSTSSPAERSVESSPTGVRRVQPVQLERPGSGRKRHRKTLAPRRIPPSRFDS